MRRTCGCGTVFETEDLRKRVCRKGCGRTSGQAHGARTRTRLAHDVQFIAVDGEGDTTLPGDPYVLLSVGDQSLHAGGRRLTHHDIFPFLWEQHLRNPNAAFVGFFLGYDFSQWLKSISLHEAKMLLTKEGIAKRKRTKSGGNPMPFPVHIGDEWLIDVLAMKRFKLQPKGAKDWMYICDVGSYFQTSLLNAINPKEWRDDPICTAEEYDIVVAGKTTRDNAEFGEDMIRYNVLENRILERMMGRLNKGFTAIDVRLTKQKWFGPGQAAQAWMGNNGMPTTVEVKEVMERELIDMARATYYGGWFEVFAHGNIPGTTYEYDINSAYPHIMRSLPCLLHGKWTDGLGSKNAYTMVKAQVWGNDPHVGAMQHRDAKERILRPHVTIGTYWLSELQAAKRAGVVSKWKVIEAKSYEACDCPPPMAGVADLYQQRLDVGKGTVHGKACKLVYNSMYGKTAQSAGMPKYANPMYASLITSGCRTMILDAIATHPNGTEDLIMVATDGVYFKTPHPGLDLDDNRLGAWGAAELHNLTILKPGVYWHDANRESVRSGMGFKLKSRGVSARDLAGRMDEFDAMFRDWMPNKPWPSLRIPIAFRVTGPKVALMRNSWEKCGESVRDDSVIVDSDPALKRDTSGIELRDGMWVSKPYSMPPSGVLEALPYKKEFGMGDGLDDEAGAWLSDTPDGAVKDIFNALLGR